MEPNQTILTEVILLGFSHDPNINVVLFVVFFLTYVITLFGNILIIGIIFLLHHLHNPMYYFLCILSFVDLGNLTTVVPRLLADLFSVNRSISFRACVAQCYVSLLMGGTECLLLAVMAYDRYIAICQPLHYLVLMRWGVCYRLTALIWITSFLMFVFPPLISPVPLCNPNQINHFMCELLAMMRLMCYHLYTDKLILFFVCFISMVVPLMFILGTYSCIISSVLKIQSVQRSKAFSTCSSHLIVVLLFYGTAMILNFGTNVPCLSSQGKYISLFYYIICPMLNPIIYSLNNKEIRKNLTKQNIMSIFGFYYG